MAGYKGPGPLFNQTPIDTFTGDGTTVSFPLSYNPGTVNGLIIAVGGAVQRPGSDFTCTGTTLLFTSAPPAPSSGVTQNILVIYRGVAGSAVVPVDGSVNVAKLAPDVLAAFAQLGQTQTFTKAQRGAVASLPATTGNLTFNFASSNNFAGTVTGNVTFLNSFTNASAGQSGIISITQNGSALYNWSFGTNWKYAGGSTSIPSQTQVLGAIDEIIYYIKADLSVSFAVRSNVS